MGQKMFKPRPMVFDQRELKDGKKVFSIVMGFLIGTGAFCYYGMYKPFVLKQQKEIEEKKRKKMEQQMGQMS
ncbi:hypothetical protein ACF0H5_010937 [Mactra antiquata]